MVLPYVVAGTTLVLGTWGAVAGAGALARRSPAGRNLAFLLSLAILGLAAWVAFRGVYYFLPGTDYSGATLFFYFFDLIGGCIALLGGVAFTVALRTRPPTSEGAE